MAKRFAELGIPFPLFEGPSDQAAEYGGLGTCSLCGGHRQHCFQLEVGSALMLPCPTCGTENGLDRSSSIYKAGDSQKSSVVAMEVRGWRFGGHRP